MSKVSHLLINTPEYLKSVLGENFTATIEFPTTSEKPSDDHVPLSIEFTEVDPDKRSLREFFSDWQKIVNANPLPA